MTTMIEDLPWTDKQMSYEASDVDFQEDGALNFREPIAIDLPNVTARDWFTGGARVPYDRRHKKILSPGDTAEPGDIVHVFRRVANNETIDNSTVWTSFLPGWPDGSFGWAKVEKILASQNEKPPGPQLFVEYIGQGDSDKPTDHAYGTVERADLVEAFWKSEGISTTFIVGFDYSSLVALELLSRQQEQRDRGVEPATRDRRCSVDQRRPVRRCTFPPMVYDAGAQVTIGRTGDVAGAALKVCISRIDEAAVVKGLCRHGQRNR